jgi:hypothetical protein
VRAAILLLLCSLPARGDDFHVITLPHYVVRVQTPRLPNNMDIDLESIHTRLSFDLSLFSPWMTKDRVNLYVYKDQQAYAAGEFKPSPWSIGYSLYENRILLVYPQANRKATLEVIAHESTHLYFESYWAEKSGDQPPAWINEGLAMLEESDTRMHPDQSNRFRSMLELPSHYIPLDRFFTIAPAKDLAKAEDKPEVIVWYSEAFSIAFFLLRKHTGKQFKEFCDGVRAGKSVEDSLRDAYRFANMAEFEHAWMKWLNEPTFSRKMNFGSASAPPSLDSQSTGSGSMPGLKSGFSNRLH